MPSSLTRFHSRALASWCHPTCVGFGTARSAITRRFSWRPSRAPSERRTSPSRHASALWGTDLPMPRPKRLHPLFHQEAALAFRMRLRSNSRVGYRNVGLLSIGCAFRPGLRCRLTPGGRTWPGKPWDSGVGDSHPDFRYSCPHNHSQALQRSFRAAFDAAWDALLPRIRDASTTSAGGLTPDHFRRGISRPVSCYALFK